MFNGTPVTRQQFRDPHKQPLRAINIRVNTLAVSNPALHVTQVTMCVKTSPQGTKKQQRVGGKGKNVPCLLFPTSHWECLAYHASGDVVRNGSCHRRVSIQRGPDTFKLTSLTHKHMHIQTPYTKRGFQASKQCVIQFFSQCMSCLFIFPLINKWHTQK